MNTPSDRRYMQGTPEWLAFRKSHITSTDAAPILGMSHYKTALQLYNEKVSPIDQLTNITPAMQRGLDLEPIAREYFTLRTGIKLIPKDDPRNVVVHPEKTWMMASFDGVSECGEVTVEIKCPGLNSKDHELAKRQEMPEIYIPQNQHHLEVKRPRVHFYVVFDGFGGPFWEVKKDEAFCKNMLEQEYEFYTLLNNKTPPEPSEGDYRNTESTRWLQVAERIRRRKELFEQMKREEEEDKNILISESGGQNTRGGGVSLCQILRKGNVDYSKIPVLKEMDLDPYRKPSTTSWRMNVA